MELLTKCYNEDINQLSQVWLKDLFVHLFVQALTNVKRLYD